MRKKLKDRRLSKTEEIEWRGRHWSLGIGFYEDGTVGEIFAQANKIGSDEQELIDDACIVMSLCLQAGIPAEQLAKHLSREPVRFGEPHASPIGMLANFIAKTSTEESARCGRAQQWMNANMEKYNESHMPDLRSNDQT